MYESEHKCQFWLTIQGLSDTCVNTSRGDQCPQSFNEWYCYILLYCCHHANALVQSNFLVVSVLFPWPIGLYICAIILLMINLHANASIGHYRWLMTDAQWNSSVKKHVRNLETENYANIPIRIDISIKINHIELECSLSFVKL